jgi:hypothetical protein
MPFFLAFFFLQGNLTGQFLHAEPDVLIPAC